MYSVPFEGTGRERNRPWESFSYSTYMYPDASSVPEIHAISELSGSKWAVADRTVGAGGVWGVGVSAGESSEHADTSIARARVTAVVPIRLISRVAPNYSATRVSPMTDSMAYARKLPCIRGPLMLALNTSVPSGATSTTTRGSVTKFRSVLPFSRR